MGYGIDALAIMEMQPGYDDFKEENMTLSTITNGVFILSRNTKVLGVYSDLDLLFLHEDLKSITMGQVMEERSKHVNSTARGNKKETKFVIGNVHAKSPEDSDYFRITELAITTGRKND